MAYPSVLSEMATLDLALQGYSLARFGDGELKLATGRSAKSQAWDPNLQAMLRQILGAKAGAPCVPCIPRVSPPGPKAAFWKEFEATTYTRLYRDGATYGSAFVTRPDSAPVINTPEYWQKVRQLWEGRDVVLLRGSGKSLTADRLPGAASVREIIGPIQHAWASQTQLFMDLRREKRPVLLCLGATATALAWRLAWEGVHAIDLGHIGLFTKRIGPDGTVQPKDVGAKE